ncbi:MAG: hypothetical protein MUE94_02215 [Verrucomicrobia bacterium]|jgi:hypothetical protein|nr:hypothetical protein [Verrucomicrobiota bacterium]
MKGRLIVKGWRLALALGFLCLAGCASKGKHPTPAQQQFAAGQESAFMMLQQSGVSVVRVVGPFQRPILGWTAGMTVSQVILEAGYLESRQPSRILIQRGPTALTVDPSQLLEGQDAAVEPGDVIHVFP